MSSATGTHPFADAHQRVAALAEELAARGETAATEPPDPVNTPMVRHWAQALGDTNPVYLDEEAAAASVHGGLVAPPAMIQVWTMGGPSGNEGGPSSAAPLLELLDETGFTGVVATNCEQTYDRYVRPGERLRSTTRMGPVAGPKNTGMGEGYFVTWFQTWYAADSGERVAEMMFRVLKFRPGEPTGDQAGTGEGAAAKREPYPLQPAIGTDTQYFWDGVAAGELRIQRCAECGQLRHPPGPMCPSCHATKRDYQVASGWGEIYSFVVHHHPPVPGRETPFTVALVELAEGVRMTGNVLGIPPDQVRIGMPVRVTYERMDDHLVLPQWTPADGGGTGGSPGTTDVGTERGRQ